MRNPMKTNPQWKPKIKVTIPANLKKNKKKTAWADVPPCQDQMLWEGQNGSVHGNYSRWDAETHTCVGSANSQSFFFFFCISWQQYPRANKALSQKDIHSEVTLNTPTLVLLLWTTIMSREMRGNCAIVSSQWRCGKRTRASFWRNGLSKNENV